MINVAFIRCSEVVTDGIGREGGLSPVIFPDLNHGRFGTLTFFVSVPDEGLDRFPG